MKEMAELLTVEEVSDVFKVQPSTIQSWVTRGIIPEWVMFKVGEKKNRGTIRFIKNKLNDWILNGDIQT